MAGQYAVGQIACHIWQYTHESCITQTMKSIAADALRANLGRQRVMSCHIGVCRMKSRIKARHLRQIRCQGGDGVNSGQIMRIM